MRIGITSTNDAANYALTDPNGQPIKRVASEARSGEFVLNTTGDYTIGVGSPTDGVTCRVALEIQ